MYVISVNGYNSKEDAAYLEQMFRLRARVFSGRLGWEVAVKDEKEFDWFDELEPTYIICVLEDGTVAGSVRLLPALGPTMLTDVFPQLISPGCYTPHDRMTESSRFCVDTSLQVSSNRQTVHKVTNALFAGAIEWSMFNGLNEFVTVTDLRFERILGLTRWRLQRIGEPIKIGVTTAIAGTLPADNESFNKLKPEGYQSRFPTTYRAAA